MKGILWDGAYEARIPNLLTRQSFTNFKSPKYVFTNNFYEEPSPRHQPTTATSYDYRIVSLVVKKNHNIVEEDSCMLRRVCIDFMPLYDVLRLMDGVLAAT